MKNIHLILNATFTHEFIKRINSEFKEYDNTFWVVNNDGFNPITDYENVKMISIHKSNVLKMLREFVKFDKIFIHDCMVPHVYLLLLLSLIPKKLKKQYWVIWGYDLYNYQKIRMGIKSKIVEFIRSRFIKNVRGIIFWVKGEYDLAVKWYGTKAKYFPGGYMDDFSLQERLHSMPKTKRQDKSVKIQVGNSANPRNCHIDVIKKLAKIDDGTFEIYCPLSYPNNTEYVSSVIEVGRQLFGERFIAMMDFVPKEQYFEYLNSIDIGVFNTNRQMGLGNISLMLALGKKVYINDYTTPWAYFVDSGAKIFSLNTFDFDREDSFNNFVSLLSDDEKENNYLSIKSIGTIFYESWKKIFED